MILNIAAYLFVAIDDADALAVRLSERAEADAFRGSILVTPEGLNLFLAGEADVLRRFLAWLREDPRFASLQAKESWSETVPFARLKVKRKEEVIAFRREHASPLDAGERALHHAFQTPFEALQCHGRAGYRWERRGPVR